jgi:hypothetical protein
MESMAVNTMRDDFISAEMCFIGRTAGYTVLANK